MRVVYQRPTVESDNFTYPTIPSWVSTMGLEWLYEVLWKSNHLWKTKLAQEK